jgi:alanyl-tRNA synthetase
MPAERLYYADSALTRFSATVTDIRERSRSGGASVWQIALDRSAFYPASGGQPYDTGTLIATAPSGARLEAPVVDVEEDEHREVWHLTPKPLLAGTQVEGLVDLARRVDHMQQHSGQHLLSALFYRELSALTVSFHLGDAVSTIDLNREQITPAQLSHIEQLANEIVAQARPVTLRSVSAEDADLLLQAGTLRKLPVRSGDIRLVVIAGEGAPNPDLDVNACGGTHVSSTSQIGAVLIRGTERVRQTTRVSFLCGNRAIAAARADDTLLAQLGREFSAGRAEIPAAVARLKAELRAGGKERQALREDLANYHAARLLVEDPPQNDLRIVVAFLPTAMPNTSSCWPVASPWRHHTRWRCLPRHNPVPGNKARRRWLLPAARRAAEMPASCCEMR